MGTHSNVLESCPQCGKEVKNLKNHEFNMHQNKTTISVKCDLCPKEFKSQSLLKKHKECHGDGTNNDITCDICKKTFKKSSLKHHNLIHSGIKSHQCNKCDKSFTQKGVLKRHEVICK